MIAPLTHAEWAVLCQAIVSMPYPDPWLAARNEALLRFFYAFGTRAKETSVYRLGDVFEPTGQLKRHLPVGRLQAGNRQRPAWLWREVLPTVGPSLQRWWAVYPAPREAEMPLWVSRKHRTRVHHLQRESVFRPVKEAGRWCGLAWVNPESIRLTKICHDVERQWARARPHTLPEFAAIIEAARREMRHQTVHRTWAMLAHAGVFTAPEPRDVRQGA